MKLRFHFAPLLTRLDRTNNAVRTEEPEGSNLSILPLGDFPLKASLNQGWVSPRYGVKEKTPVATYGGRVKLPVDLVLLLYPHEGPTDINAVRAAGRKALLHMRRTLILSLNANRSRPAETAQP